VTTATSQNNFIELQKIAYEEFVDNFRPSL